jgi:hypothetical protein
MRKPKWNSRDKSREKSVNLLAYSDGKSSAAFGLRYFLLLYFPSTHQIFMRKYNFIRLYVSTLTRHLQAIDASFDLRIH